MMNDNKIGLKNLIAYLELEYWLRTLNIQAMVTNELKATILRDVLYSIVNNKNNIRSLSLEDLINYSRLFPNPTLINYIENIINVKNEITNENIEEHKSYLNTQIIYAHLFNRNLYSLDLKSSTMSIKFISLQRNIFDKIFKNEEMKINEHSEFETTNKYKIFKKTLYKKNRVIGGPKEYAEYISKR